MKVIGNENANKLLEWSIEGDDLIDADADEYVLIAYMNMCIDYILLISFNYNNE